MILNLPPGLSSLNKVIKLGRDAVLFGIGTLDQKIAQLLLLRRIELARAARFGAVEQALQPFGDPQRPHARPATNYVSARPLSVCQRLNWHIP